MTLRQLYYFRNVAELRHYTKAAEISRASQSGLSHAIRELERELNVELFQKRGRNVELTKYGQLFLPYVQKALKMLESGVSRLADPAGPDTGTITIAGTPSLAQFASDIIVRYMADTKRAGVRLQFNQETTIAQLREHLLSGKVDLAFSTKIEHSQIGSTYIGEHPIVLLVSETHRFAQYGEVELRMLDGEDFIAFSPDCQLRKLVDGVSYTGYSSRDKGGNESGSNYGQFSSGQLRCCPCTLSSGRYSISYKSRTSCQ